MNFFSLIVISFFSFKFVTSSCGFSNSSAAAFDVLYVGASYKPGLRSGQASRLLKNKYLQDPGFRSQPYKIFLAAL